MSASRTTALKLAGRTASLVIALALLPAVAVARAAARPPQADGREEGSPRASRRRTRPDSLAGRAAPARSQDAGRTLARAAGRAQGRPQVRQAPQGAAARTCRAAKRPPKLATTAGLRTRDRPIELLRSYDIPKDDPSYDRLLNWSWSYDSAIAAAAFSAQGESSRQATRLLDQLSALQRTDGSIDLAFNARDRARPPLLPLRSGTIAWLGLAAVTYDAAFDSDRYRDTAERAAGFLLSRSSQPNGLIAGGPDVKWVSTQHNLVAYTLLDRLGDELARAGDDKHAGAFHEAAATIGAAIDERAAGCRKKDSALLPPRGSTTTRGHWTPRRSAACTSSAATSPELGKLVLAGAERGVRDRQAVDRGVAGTTRRPSTPTYEADGPFIGYKPVPR